MAETNMYDGIIPFENQQQDGLDLDYNGMDTSSKKQIIPEYMNYIFKSLLVKGYSPETISALMGTIAEKSGGDPYAISDDDSRQGIMQWDDNDYHINRFYTGGPYEELDRQLNFLTKDYIPDPEYPLPEYNAPNPYPVTTQDFNSILSRGQNPDDVIQDKAMQNAYALGGKIYRRIYKIPEPNINAKPKQEESRYEKKPEIYERWYDTIPQDRNNTRYYNLRKAYEILPIEQLEKWRTATPEELESDEYRLPLNGPDGIVLGTDNSLGFVPVRTVNKFGVGGAVTGNNDSNDTEYDVIQPSELTEYKSRSQIIDDAASRAREIKRTNMDPKEGIAVAASLRGNTRKGTRIYDRWLNRGLKDYDMSNLVSYPQEVTDYMQQPIDSQSENNTNPIYDWKSFEEKALNAKNDDQGYKDFKRQLMYQLGIDVDWNENPIGWADEKKWKELYDFYSSRGDYKTLIDLINSISTKKPLPDMPVRVWNNDTPTAERSSELEYKMRTKMYNEYYINTGRRDEGTVRNYHVEKAPQYVIPWGGDENIIYLDKYRATPNILNEIAKYAGKVGLPIEDALGLAAQETQFGRIPYFNMGVKTNSFSDRELGNADYLRAFGRIPAEALVRDFAYSNDNVDPSIPPLQHAFQYFKDGNYNRNDPEHTSDVRDAGNKVFNSKAGQEWWQNEGQAYYEGTKK